MRCSIEMKSVCSSLGCWWCCSPTARRADLDDEHSLEGHDISSQWKDPLVIRTSSNNIEYTQIGTPDDAVAADEEPLDSQFDPDEAYIVNFERLGIHEQTIQPIKGMVSSSQMEEILCQSEVLLSHSSPHDLTPREVIINLNRYASALRHITDLDKKRAYIQRYESHKNEYDRDNRDDKEQAELFLKNAEDASLSPRERIQYYQTAIKYTNDLDAKDQIRSNYRRYCFSLKQRKTT